METVILVLHVLAAAGICGLVLLQHGKGADVGAAFGSGSAGSVFGSAGSANFLSRATAILALVFFLTSLGLTYFSSRKSDNRGVMADHPVTQQKAPGQTPLEIPGQTPPGRSEAQPLPPGAPAAPGVAPAESGRAQEVPK
jgi:preprotein translocase subunit SecG